MAWLAEDLNGHPAIVVNSMNSAVDTKDDLGNDVHSKKFAFAHELAHHVQTKLWGHLYSVPQEIQNRLGWGEGLRPNKDGGTSIVPRILTKDGRGFCAFGSDGKGLENRTWITCRKANEGLGESLKLSVEELVPNSVIRQEATVAPATYYFDSPVEETAEALAAFRTSESTRLHLLRTDKTLYDVAKQLDQQDIDASPRIRHDQGRPVRLPNGELVPNAAAARQAIEQFELRQNANP